MRNRLFHIALTLMFTLSICAQNPNEHPELYKLQLKTGETIYGGITYETTNILIIQTITGDKLQYPKSAVNTLTPIKATKAERITNRQKYNYPNFGLKVRIQGGISSALLKKSGGFFDANMNFMYQHIGSRNRIAIGPGVGYQRIFTAATPIDLIPLYVHTELTNHKTIAPYATLDLGYAFGLRTEAQGGLMAQLGTGVKFTINPRNRIHLGIFAKVQQVKTEVSTTIDGETFYHLGNKGLVLGGVSFGFVF